MTLSDIDKELILNSQHHAEYGTKCGVVHIHIQRLKR